MRHTITGKSPRRCLLALALHHSVATWSLCHRPVHRWEPLELLRKLVLTGFVLLISESRVFLRLVLALFFTLAFMILYLQLRPFKATENDIVAIGGQIGLACVFLGVGYLKLYDTIAKTALGESGAVAIMGFEDTTSLVTIMMVATIAMLILFLATVTYKISTIAPVGGVRLRKTGKEPELMAYAKMRYHAFLSHVSGCEALSF